MRIALLCSLSVVLSGFAARGDQPPAPPSRSPPTVAVELTSLRLMRDKGIITQAEYESALRDLGESIGAHAENAPTVLLGRWSTTLYGFVEADHIYDSSESFNDLAGNNQVARPGSYGGGHGRVMFGVRNSRLGFRLRAPEFHGVRASAMLEMDFLGNQPPTTEQATFTNPTFRIRHFNLKIETPIVDVLIGQYWQLFGWQSVYQPNTVEIQGVPGEIYSRTPQIRIGKTLKNEWVTLEAAVAVMRPPQRDAAVPEGQAGLRLALNKWTGMQTNGATGTTIAPLSVALTGDLRRFNVAEFAAKPQAGVGATGWAVAAAAFVPVIPASTGKRGNSLSVSGEFAYGYGTADLYTGLVGGVSHAKLPNPGDVYTPNIDPGLVAFNGDGTLDVIQWSSFLVGAQYYLPRLDGRVWVSANYSHMESQNAKNHAAQGNPRASEDWVDGNLFADVTPSVRLGLEYAYFNDHYADGVSAVNHRLQLSAFYLF